MPTENFAEEVSRLYARWTLDPLVESAHAISKDIVARPALYCGGDIPEHVVPLRISYGALANYPDATQRQATMLPLFGRSDSGRMGGSDRSSFQVARRVFFEACAAFVEHADVVQVGILEERVRSATHILRAYFHGVHGRSFQLTAEQISAVFEVATNILRSKGVTRVFGVESIEPEWPFGANEQSGAKLIEAIGNTLSLPLTAKFSLAEFLILQQTAKRGHEAIRLLLSVDTSDASVLRGLVEHGYQWESSLRQMYAVEAHHPARIAPLSFPGVGSQLQKAAQPRVPSR
jgi:hypothetical protein